MNQVLLGAAVFPGLTSGSLLVRKSVVVEDQEFQGVPEELTRLQRGLKLTQSQIEKVRDLTKSKMKAEEAEIFEAHLMMLLDPEYQEMIQGKIENEKKSAATAIQEVTEEFIQVLGASNSAYLRERVLDLKDISSRWIRNLNQSQEAGLTDLSQNILVAQDLTPSELMELSWTPPKGVVLSEGGLTSHTAILLKALGIPSLFQVRGLDDLELTSCPAILDSTQGKMILNPNPDELKNFELRHQAELKKAERLQSWTTKPTQLKDGTQTLLVANVSAQVQVEKAVEMGAEGVGLYRTEFLFMDRSSPPSEDEQFRVYQQALRSFSGKPITIRTMDIGGDKQIPYLNLPKEENPFLGVRGLRLSLQQKDLFATQLKALIRASEEGPLQVMFPMVTEPSEIDETFELIDSLLAGESRDSVQIQWGMMIEIPSNLFQIQEFAKRLSFFSVGTNDLGQYLSACDRMNTHLQSINTIDSLGFLRALEFLARSVKASGRSLSICGEMASDLKWAPVLLGLGFEKLSINARLIAEHREFLSQWSLADCQKLAQRILSLTSRDEVRAEIGRVLTRP